MKLSREQLAEILSILDKIDEGRIRPRIGDRIGRFLRQYESGRPQVDAVLSQERANRRTDGAVSGAILGPIALHSLTDATVDVLAFPLGEVAGTVVFSEQLGGLLNLRMWLKAHAANVAFELLRNGPAVQLEGDYRWTPVARLTPGEAHVEAAAESVAWQHARCLKAVADDLSRPAHALEYVLDYRLGPAGLKFFRTVAARKHGDRWEAIPAVGDAAAFDAVILTSQNKIQNDGLSLLLMYCEPWSRVWTVVDAAPLQPHEVFAHAIVWADFQREIAELESDLEIVGGVRDALRRSGVAASSVGEARMSRELLPVARAVIRSLRGYSR